MTVTQKPFVSSFTAQSTAQLPRFESSNGRLNIFSADGHDAADMEMARFIMALRAKGMRETALLSAFEHAPRRAFFPEEHWPYLYSDVSLPLPCGEEAPSAHVIAETLRAAGLAADQRVLEIGTGSGYQAALIGLIAREVVSLERCRTLATRARRALSSHPLSNLGRKTVDVRLADGMTGGDLQGGLFDRIIVNGVVEECPAIWFDRLATGGALIAALAEPGGAILVRAERIEGVVRQTVIGASRLPRLKPGRAQVL